MSQLMVQDDVYWRQRAKKHWYKDGDKNTKFFHASATTRKKVNRILSLEDENGVKLLILMLYVLLPKITSQISFSLNLVI
jgi:hypothetical protein